MQMFGIIMNHPDHVVAPLSEVLLVLSSHSQICWLRAVFGFARCPNSAR